MWLCLTLFSCPHLSWTHLYWQQLTRNALQYSRCSDIPASRTMESILIFFTKNTSDPHEPPAFYVYSQEGVIYSWNSCYFHLVLRNFSPFVLLHASRSPSSKIFLHKSLQTSNMNIYQFVPVPLMKILNKITPKTLIEEYYSCVCYFTFH